MHVLLYGGLGALLRWALHQSPAAAAGHGAGLAPRQSPRHGAGQALALAFAFGYGLAMECLQSLFAGGSRVFGWDDVAANAAGAVLFWFLAGRLLTPLTAAMRPDMFDS